MTTDKTALKRGEEALEAMLAEGKKVTMNSVAKRAGFSHANFRYAEFADLKDDIEKAAAKQVQDKLSNNVEILKRQVIDLKRQLTTAKQQATASPNDKADEVQGLMVKLTECYRLNDKLKGENFDLRNQLAHQMGNTEEVLKFNKNTGEIISGVFDK